MDVLLVEPFYTGSHRSWAEGYADNSRFDVRLVTHPGVFWRWRLRGGAVTLAGAIRQDIASNGIPDVLLVSSMVDLAAMLGLLRRDLNGVPVVLYLHENQVCYPRGDARDVDAAHRTWTSMLAADRVLINSKHHLDLLTDGLEELLASAPDMEHGHLLDDVVDGICVVPVGVDMGGIRIAGTPNEVPVVLWNHRWDADKNPDVFVRAVKRIAGDGRRLRVVLAGEDAWDGAPRCHEAKEMLGELVQAVGPFDREEYLDLLATADVVVSVADHEFFGVAVVEAIAAGCVPVLPEALSYPEIVPQAYHSQVLYPLGDFRRRLDEVVSDLATARDNAAGLSAAMERFSWANVAPLLDAQLTRAKPDL